VTAPTEAPTGVAVPSTQSRNSATTDSLLLVLPVPTYVATDGCRYVERQAVNGLARWAEHFSPVTVALVAYSASHACRIPGLSWECVDGISSLARTRIVELPYGYPVHLHAFLVARVRRVLEQLISTSRYLCFAIGGYFGDWGSQAALIAARHQRKFSVWTDRVESEVIRFETSKKRNVTKRFIGRIYAYHVAAFERRVIRHAELGLFHGRDTYEAYKCLVPHAHEVDDIHLSPSDRAPADAVEGKVDSILRSVMSAGDPRPLHMGYAGRAAEMKAPLDWLRVIKILVNQGVTVNATWLGDGPMLARMEAFCRDNGLNGVVSLPGFVADRARVIRQLREWDLLLFTHITPESPRVLIEALVSGTPIVGYASPYARGLVKGFGEDQLVPIGAVDQLAARVRALHVDRARLDQLIRCSYQAGDRFNDVAVFRHRSGLIKAYLP
jgi:colanic acid/amylovoran biosynthesis glycosyltransferase